MWWWKRLKSGSEEGQVSDVRDEGVKWAAGVLSLKKSSGKDLLIDGRTFQRKSKFRNCS